MAYSSRLLLTAFSLLFFWVTPAFALEVYEQLEDPALEARAREISKELRCPVCQNNSIDDSSAQLARDLRKTVRERLVAGDNDQQVLDFVSGRYGDFVLLRPPVRANTLLLWGAPLIALLMGGGLFWAWRTHHQPDQQAEKLDAPLNAAEQAELKAFLAKEKSDDA